MVLEIIVGDTGTTNKDVLNQYIKHGDQVKIVEDLKYHFSKCNNTLVFEHASCDHLLFLNNDIFQVIQLSILKCINAFIGDDNLGSVGVHLFFKDGTIQHAGIDFLKYTIERIALSSPLKKENSLSFNSRIPAVTGACLMTSFYLFEAVGGMDEAYQAECKMLLFALV